MNVKYKHAALFKLALIACLLFVAAWFTFCASAQSPARPHDYQAQGTGDTLDPWHVSYDNSLFIDPLQPGYLNYFSGIKRAKNLIVP